MSDRESRRGSFLDELKRRRVVRVAIGYAAAAFVILQAADIILPALLVPEWGFRVLVIATLAGFPVAVVLAWVFQWTPEGLRRTRDDDVGDTGGVVLGRSRAVYLVIGAVLLAGISAVWWLSPRSAAGSVTPGAEVIAVLPFSAPGSDGLGEGMVDLLSRNLDEVEGVRLVDPRMVLHRWNARAERGPVTRPVELEIGREVEAGSILTGSIVTLGESVEIEADLISLDGTRLASADVRGTTDDLFGLVDRLSIDLLNEIWRAASDVPDVGLRDVTTESVDAMRAFLDGERHYRASAWPQALNSYRRAVAADTGFALAYYRMTRTLGWMSGDRIEERVRYADLALRFAERLPTRMRGLAVSEQLWLAGEAEASIDSLEAIVERYPDDPEAWHRLADNRYHEEFEYAGPLAPSVDVQLETFERVLELDPTFLPAIIHPIEVAFRYDDTTRITRYAAMVERAPSTHPMASRILAAGEEMSKDPGDVLAQIQTLALALPEVPEGLPQQVRQAVLPSARRATATLPASDRDMLVMWLRGQIARSESDPLEARDFLLSALVSGGRLAEAREVADAMGGDPAVRYWRDPVYAGYVSPEHLDALPRVDPSPLVRATAGLVWAVRSGDVEATRRVADLAREGREGEGDAPADWTALGEAAEGFALALDGDADGLDRIETALRRWVDERFASNPRPLLPGSFTEPLWFWWLDLAARNEATRERALTLLERPWAGRAIFEVMRLRSLSAALAGAGRVEEARATGARFAAALADADPGLPIAAAAEAAAGAARAGTADG